MNDAHGQRDGAAATTGSQLFGLAEILLRGMAVALWVAAGIVGVLMGLVWVLSGTDLGGRSGDFDFPGRYLFALLPMVGAAWTMHNQAATVRHRR